MVKTGKKIQNHFLKFAKSTKFLHTLRDQNQEMAVIHGYSSRIDTRHINHAIILELIRKALNFSQFEKEISFDRL